MTLTMIMTSEVRPGLVNLRTIASISKYCKSLIWFIFLFLSLLYLIPCSKSQGGLGNVYYLSLGHLLNRAQKVIRF